MRDARLSNDPLEKLLGHFVRKSQSGYGRSRTDRPMFEAVSSGAVTAAPGGDRTEVDQPCHWFGESIEVTSHEERVELSCTACSETYAPIESPP